MNAQAATGAAARAPISVNGAVIERAAIAREAQHHPAASPGESMRAASQALVVRALLVDEARRRGIAAEPARLSEGRVETEGEALVRGLMETAVTVPSPSADEVRRYYEANRGRFRAPDLHEARHILIAARRDDAEAFAAARQMAVELAADIAALPESFGELARVFSACPSRHEGGHLGQFTAADVTPEFAEAVRRLAPGETTAEPVETRYGFHLIRLERRVEGATLPLSAVAERIAAYLVERTRRTATAQFIARLVSAAEIKGIALAGAEAHRVY